MPEQYRLTVTTPKPAVRFAAKPTLHDHQERQANRFCSSLHRIEGTSGTLSWTRPSTVREMCSQSLTVFAFPLACNVTWVPTASASKQCLEPVVTSPARESTHSSVRPGITWEAVPGGSDYRLRLTSRQPEGRTFATIDTPVSGTRFVAPQALTDGFAVVRVSVTSQCPAGAVSTHPPAAEHRFYIDARPTCPVGGLAVDAQTGHIASTSTARRHALRGVRLWHRRWRLAFQARHPRAARIASTGCGARRGRGARPVWRGVGAASYTAY